MSPPATSKQPSFNFNVNPGNERLHQPGPAPIERQQITAQNLDAHSGGTAVGIGQEKSGRRLSLQRLRSRSETTTSSSLNSNASEASSSTAVVHADLKKDKPLMSLALAALLIYTIGVKWRGEQRYKIFVLQPDK